MLVTLLTPTGDRSQAFELCEEYMNRQTYIGDVQWIVVDDGFAETPLRMDQQRIRLESKYSGTPRSLAHNVLNAIPQIEGDIVLVIEDDDWYGPRHVEEQVKRLQNEPHRPITGHGLQEYYHLPSMKHKTFRNIGSCFCQVAFHRSLLPLLKAAAQQAFDGGGIGVDRYFWERIPKPQWHVFYDEDRQVIGMKGLPGRRGLGVGHRAFQNWTPDPSGAQLRAWIGDADAEVYFQMRREYNLT